MYGDGVKTTLHLQKKYDESLYINRGNLKKDALGTAWILARRAGVLMHLDNQ